MKLALCLLWALAHLSAQTIQIPGPGAVHSTITPASISNHGVTYPPSNCTNNTATCAQSGSDTKATVGATGNTLVGVLVVGTNIGVVVPSGCTVTGSYGATAMTFIPAAYNGGINANTVAIWPFYLKNATAGSEYLSFGISGSGCTFYYTQGIFWVDITGVSTSAPLDTSVSNSANGGNLLSVTSAGSISNSGEISICVTTTNGPSITGFTGYTQMDVGNVGSTTAFASPSPGSTTTCTITTSSVGQNALAILAVSP